MAFLWKRTSNEIYQIVKYISQVRGQKKRTWLSLKTRNHDIAQAIYSIYEDKVDQHGHEFAIDFIRKLFIKTNDDQKLVIIKNHLDGRKKSRHNNCIDEACRQLLELNKDGNSRYPTPKIADAWNVFVDHFSSTVEKTTLSKKGGYWHSMTKYLDAMTDDSPLYLEDITRTMGSDYFKKLWSTENSTNYRTHLKEIKSIWKRLQTKIAHLGDCPFDHVISKPDDGRSQTHRNLSSSEVTLIEKDLENNSPELLLPFQILIEAGLREPDICALKFSDLSTEKGQILLNPTKTKSINGIQNFEFIHLNPEITKKLKNLKSSGPQDHIFPDLAKAMKGNFWKHLFARLNIKANNEGLVGFKSFRHTTNTIMEKNKIPQSQRMKKLCQKKKETNDIYGHDIELSRTAMSSLPLKELLLIQKKYAENMVA